MTQRQRRVLISHITRMTGEVSTEKITLVMQIIGETALLMKMDIVIIMPVRRTTISYIVRERTAAMLCVCQGGRQVVLAGSRRNCRKVGAGRRDSGHRAGIYAGGSGCQGYGFHLYMEKGDGDGQKILLQDEDILTERFDPEQFFFFPEGIGIYYEEGAIDCMAAGNYVFIVPFVEGRIP